MAVSPNLVSSTSSGSSASSTTSSESSSSSKITFLLEYSSLNFFPQVGQK
jgi:hypothetical protein